MAGCASEPSTSGRSVSWPAESAASVVPIRTAVNVTRRSGLAAPVIVGVCCSLAFIARTAFIVNGEYYFTLFDDAMISMRYARNLATGHGLVWNAGQAPVEGYTNFLWTLWMALLHVRGAPE